MNSTGSVKFGAKFGSIADNLNSYAFVIFILWPFMALVLAILNFKANWAKNIVWFYTIFFGFTFVIANDQVDASVYRETLQMMSSPDFHISSIFASYFGDGSKTLDIAQRLVTYLVSRFTDDYRFLFAAFGLFLGYFLSRIIWDLADRSDNKVNPIEILLLISFSLVVGIWDMGGIRYNVAAVIFVYGIFQYMLHGHRSGLFISIITFFIHWSFVLAIIVLLIYLIFRNRTFIYFSIFIVSFLISELNIEFIRNIFNSYAPAAVFESRGSYLSENYILSGAEVAENAAWYILFYTKVLKWYILLFGLYSYTWLFKRIKTDKKLTSLFSFSLLFYGVFNLLSSIPAMGRFINMSGSLLMIASIFLTYQHKKEDFSKLMLLLGVPVLMLFIIVRIRIGFDYLGTWSIIGSPIFIYFAENNTALIDIVKELFVP